MKLSFQNVKGRSGSYDLPSVTVVHGENFSGKSAILTALRLALIGYDPSLGKTPGATWQLASGSEMSVSLWKNATHCRRTWKLAKGSVTKEEQCSTWNIPAALVDVREFLGMPAKKRAEYILGLVPVADAAVGPARLRAEIPVNHLTSEVTDFLEFWEGDRQEHGTPAGPWLANLCEQAAVKARESAAAAREAEAAMRQFVADVPAIGVADQTAEIARIEAEIDRLTREDGAHSLAQQAITGADRDRLALQAAEQELVAQRAALAACAVSVDEATSAGKAANELGESLRAARQSLEQAQAQRKKLGRTGKCPTCGCESVKLGAKLDREIAKHAAAVAELEPKLAAAEAGVSRAVASASIQAKVVALEPRIADLKSRASVATAYDEAAHAAVSKSLSDEQYRLSKTRANHHQWVKVQERRRLQAKIEASATSNKAEAATWGELAKALKRVRDGAVSEAFGDFADRIEQFTTGILPWQLQVHDGDLGYFTDGTWVSHEVFSGSEMALVYAGLGVALAGDASVKIVMMDEVLISEDNKRKIADRMLALAKQGVIDAFIIVDVTEAGWPTWCDVIRTGEEVPA